MTFDFELNSVIGSQQVREPVGWDAAQIILSRSEKYKGFTLEYSGFEKLEFTYEGCEYLKTIYHTHGTEEDVTVTVKITCVNGEYFEQDFNVNMNSYEETETGVMVNLESLSFEVAFMNRIENKVDLLSGEDLDGNPMPAVPNHTLNLHGKALLLKDGGRSQDAVGAEALPDPGTDTLYLNPNLTLDLNESGRGRTPGSQIIHCLDGTPRFEDNPVARVFFNPEQAPANITFKFRVNCRWSLFFPYNQGNKNLNWIVNVAPSNTQILTSGNIVWAGNTDNPDAFKTVNFPASATIDTIFDFEDEVNITVPARHFVFFYMVIPNVNQDTTNPLPVIASFREHGVGVDWQISGISITPGTHSPSLLIHESLERIVRMYTGAGNAFKSLLYGRTDSAPRSYPSNGCGSFRAILSGWMVRNFPDRDLVTSFDEMFDSLDAIDSIGMSVEEQEVVLEGARFFFDPSETVMTLRNISGLVVSHDESMTYNSVSIGYETYEIDEILTIDEVNTENEYSVDLKKVKESYDKKSALVTSGYTLEFTRRRQHLSVSDDQEAYKYDTNIFLVELNKSNKSIAEKNEGMTVSGVISPETSYNLRLNPLRNLFRHLGFITGGVQKLPAAFARFITTRANNVFELQFSSGSCPGTLPGTNTPVIMNIDLLSGIDEAQPVFLPIKYEFEAPLSFSDFRMLREINVATGKRNIYHCIEISRNDIDFKKVFIKDLRYRVSEGMASFECLEAYE